MHCWCLSFSKPLHCKTNRFFAEDDDGFFNFGDNIDVFSSPKSVRNYSSHQNQWGETCYIVVTNKMFFSVIKLVLKSSLNSVQSYRNKKIRVKNVTEFSEKKCDSPRRATKRALNSVTKKEIHRIQ